MVNTWFLFLINFSILLSDSTSKQNKTNIYKDLSQVIPSVLILIETNLKVEEQVARIRESFRNMVTLVLLEAKVETNESI